MAPPTTTELADRWQRLDRLHLGAFEDERRLMWGLLGAGLASVGDTVGLLRARHSERELLDGLAELALTPTVGPPPVGAGLSLGIAGRF